MKHEIVRVKHELQRRTVTVVRVERLTPHMQRIVLGGDSLEGFASPAADDHVKLFVPTASGVEGRDYTPRFVDSAARTLTLDFALHDAGPATAWARRAAAGQTIEIAGPRGSSLVPTDFDWWLLVGDETALPAIGRRVEALPSGTPVVTIVSVPGAEDQQAFDTEADHRAVWVHRSAEQAADPSLILAALADEVWPSGDGFVWIASETGIARALRRHVLEERQHPLPWTKVAGYWTHGHAGATEKFDR